MLSRFSQFFHDDRHNRLNVVVRNVGHEHKVDAFALEDEVYHWLHVLHVAEIPHNKSIVNQCVSEVWQKSNTSAAVSKLARKSLQVLTVNGVTLRYVTRARKYTLTLRYGRRENENASGDTHAGVSESGFAAIPSGLNLPHSPFPRKSLFDRHDRRYSWGLWCLPVSKAKVQPSVVSRRFDLPKWQNRFSGHRRMSCRTSRMLTDADNQAALQNTDFQQDAPKAL